MIPPHFEASRLAFLKRKDSVLVKCKSKVHAELGLNSKNEIFKTLNKINQGIDSPFLRFQLEKTHKNK